MLYFYRFNKYLIIFYLSILIFYSDQLKAEINGVIVSKNKVSVHVDQVLLYDILLEISQKTTLNYHDNPAIYSDYKITSHFDSLSLEDALKRLLIGYSYYIIYDEDKLPINIDITQYNKHIVSKNDNNKTNKNYENEGLNDTIDDISEKDDDAVIIGTQKLRNIKNTIDKRGNGTVVPVLNGISEDFSKRLSQEKI